MAARRRGPADRSSWATFTQKVLKPEAVKELIEQAHREAKKMKARNRKAR